MITRFGMNKKSLDPINDDYPFYIKREGVYQPVMTVYADGPSRSFYQAQNSTYRYVWMETEASVYHDRPCAEMRNKIHIDKDNIISNMKLGTNVPVCLITTYETCTTSVWCYEFEIHGPCQLRYSKDANPQVWIETNSDISLIGEQVD